MNDKKTKKNTQTRKYEAKQNDPKGNYIILLSTMFLHKKIILPLWRIKWRLLSEKKITETIKTKSVSRFYILSQIQTLSFAITKKGIKSWFDSLQKYRNTVF